MAGSSELAFLFLDTKTELLLRDYSSTFATAPFFHMKYLASAQTCQTII